MDALPLWPPLVAAAIGIAAVLYTRWEARRFDRDHPRR